MANTQAGALDPIATGRSTAQGIGNNALDFRWGVGGLGAPITSNSFGNTSGVFPGGTSGAGTNNDLQVTASGGMNTSVNGGQYQLTRESQGPYFGAFNAAHTQTHDASNPSLPRIDYVVIRLRDPDVDSGVTESARRHVLKGTPAASPTEPTAQLTSGDMLLAAVTVRANTTTILSSDISDRRTFVVARGGITPRPPGELGAGAYEGQYADETASNTLMRWSGTMWEPVATPAVWKQWTPPLRCTGTGGAISIGTGAQFIGRYQMVGRTLTFNYFWKWGTAPFNGGTGDIFTILPPHPITSAQLVGVGYSQWVMAHLWVNTSAYVGDFAGQALVHANTSRLTPYFFINAANNSNTKPYRIATQQGVTDGKSSIPNIFNPNGFPEGGDLQITGTCEVTWS